MLKASFDADQQWAAFPVSWIENGALLDLCGNRKAGVSIAAIRLFISFSLRANLNWRMSTTSVELMNLTQISSLSLVQATRRLIDLELIEVSRLGSRGSIYQVRPQSKYCRLPYACELRLHHMVASSPRKLALESLKMYLAICACSGASVDIAGQSADLTPLSGVPDSRVPVVLDHLQKFGLIHREFGPAEMARVEEFAAGFVQNALR